ncbi:MAG: amino acid ABC transporter substrate-binding protein [Chloroflexi bacterium]|nr:amino acid ABC transporter substrate-binding protein [Chloroflexota bacterium]MBI3339679.1 amino acid ABC transporter substrate-binding protein [Chloroflexota bacterium]
MNSKIWKLVIGIALLSLLITACGSAATPQAPTAPATTAPVVTEAPSATSEPPIKVGASLPLTGNFSAPGTAAQKGYQLWADMVNKSGGLLGRQVEFVIYDNASNPDTAVADYERLITQDKVDLVVGPFSSKLVIPTSEVAAKYGYAFPEPAGGAPNVFNRGLTNIFFAQPAPSVDQAIPFAKYVLSLPADSRPKTFAVITGDDPFSVSVVESVQKLLTDGGLTMVLKEVYPADTKDFSSLAAKVADKNPDLIIGGTQFEDSVGQIKAYQQAGYQPRGAMFTTGPSLPKEFSEALGTATEGVFAPISWFEASTIKTNPEFVKAYHDKYGSEPIAEDSANAFTVGQVLQQAVENIQSVDNAKLIEEMHKATFTTVVGPLSFDALGQPKGSFMVLQWQGGKIVIVGPDYAKQADPIWPKPQW